MRDDNSPYADMMDLPHHKAANRRPMSMHDRAAQFSPFAALTGFDDVIAESGRLTERKPELSEHEKDGLDQTLRDIAGKIRVGEHPEIGIVYFVPDLVKEGGAYREYTGRVRTIDPIGRTIVFLDANGQSAGMTVEMDAIVRIELKEQAAEDSL